MGSMMQMPNPGADTVNRFSGNIAALQDAKRKAEVMRIMGGGMEPLGRINYFTGSGY
jgi:hypothetical protein